jgi:membrane fusion protein (multidrug efflux system)
VTRNLLFLIFLVIALLAGGAAWLRGRGAAAPAPVAAAPGPAMLEFAEADLLTLVPTRLSRTIPLTGTLRPVNQTVVRTKVAGELREVTVREGMTVRRGQIVARVDTSEFDVRVSERAAQLTAAESQVAQALRTYQNTRQLHDRNFVSQSALDTARSGWEVATGNRDAAAAQLALARKALADTRLVAPIDGTVSERFAQAGEKLPVDGRVLSIVDLSRMEIEAPVPAAEIGAVRVGQTVTLAIEGVAQPHTGQIVRIAPSTQTGTRSVPVYIALDHRDPQVRAGLFAQGSLAVQTRDSVLTVPATALRDAGGRTFVYAVEDGLLVERDVTLGLRDESQGARGPVEVVRGLSAGDRIVAANLGALRAGSRVAVTGGTGPGSAAATPTTR